MGCIFGADAAVQDGSGSDAVGGSGRRISRYIVDLQYAAVRYVEATAAQLLPRLCIGDRVWCKPSMAHPNQLSASSKLRMQQQQQQQQLQQLQDQSQQQQQQQQPQQRDPWFSAEWVLGQVVNTQLHASVPVCEVQMADGDSCWFPNIHLEPVREVGESSSAAEAWGIAQLMAATAVTGEPAAEATAAADLQQQQQGQLAGPQQRQPERTAGPQQQEMPLVLSSGSGHGLHAAGSTGTMHGAAQGSCGAAASPDVAIAGGGSTADAAAIDMDVPAAAAAPTAVIQAGDVGSGAVTAAPNAQHVAADEEVADSTDLLMLLPPPAESEGDNSGPEQAAEGEVGKARGPTRQQLPAAAVAVDEALGL
jgi:hypothetical protein